MTEPADATALSTTPPSSSSSSSSVSSSSSLVEEAPEQPKEEKKFFAPLNIPLTRRRQTAAVLIWLLTQPLCLILSLFLLRSSGFLFYLFLIYVAWMFFGQTFNWTGGHPQMWFKRLTFWEWFRDYFPISLLKTVDLDPTKNYIFGYHPHGIIGLGAFCNFATDATGYSQLFPGITLRLLTLVTNFKIPLFGLYLTALGVCDASPESCGHILTKGPGNSLMLVLGGAKESLDAHPGSYKLTLKDRKGFVKIGLQYGASLVPVFSFGETDVYDQVDNPQGSRLRKIQELLQTKMGFALPLIKGRGIFNYQFGLLPQRRAITSCVGKPIHLPKVARSEITNDMINKYHALYIEELQKLFDQHKNQYASTRRSSLSIVQ